MDLTDFNKRAQERKSTNRAFYSKLKKKEPPRLDERFSEAHDAVFESTDCLTCANCCKTTSPVFTGRDVERAAKSLRMRPGDFTTKYLHLDNEGDLVLNTAPCPFLGDDNACRIYESRPAACAGYPHTNRTRMRKYLDLTYRNTLVCPAVLEITERLRNAGL